MNVFILEYPGYGTRAGAPSKRSFLEAAEEAFRELPPSLPKFVVSESIGAGVACDLAKRHPQEIAGMALFAPYQNLAAVSQRQMPFLPAYFLLFDRFNPAECLKHYGGPVVFIVAGADEIIAPAFGRRLFEGFNGPKQFQVIPGARHNEIAEQSPDWWREVFAFWRKHSKP
jgi:pimeloyl-ACP methyl ester carboxylesterase